jgi:hypothetical protein
MMPRTGTNSTGKWGTAVLFLVGALILAGGIHRLHSGARLAAPAYGETLSAASMMRAHDGRELRIDRGRWHLLVVGSVASQGELLRGIQTLQEAAAVPSHVLQTTAFFSNTSDAIGSFGTANRVTLPIVSLHDQAAAVRRAINLTDYRPRIYLAAPDGRIAFTATYARVSDVRLLMEKHLGVSGSAESIAALAAGGRFAPDGLLDVRDGVARKLATSTSRLWVVFTAECVTCALESRLLVLRALEDRFEEVARRERRQLALLFSPSFSATAVKQTLDEHAVAASSFIAQAGLAGLEDPYGQRALLPGDTAFVLRVDAANTVESVQPFTQFTAALGK